MDPKLTILFMLIGTTISLSHLGDENLAKIKHSWGNVISALLPMNGRRLRAGSIAVQRGGRCCIALNRTWACPFSDESRQT